MAGVLVSSGIVDRLLYLQLLLDNITRENEQVEEALRQARQDKAATEDYRRRLQELEDTAARAENVHQFFEKRGTVVNESSSGTRADQTTTTNVTRILEMARHVVSTDDDDETRQLTRPPGTNNAQHKAPFTAGAESSSSSVVFAMKARTYLEQERSALQSHQNTSLRTKLARLETLKAKLKAQQHNAQSLQRFRAYQFPPQYQALFLDANALDDPDTLCDVIDAAIDCFAADIVRRVQLAKEAAESEDPLELQSAIACFDPDSSSTLMDDTEFLSSLMGLSAAEDDAGGEGKASVGAAGANLQQHLQHVRAVSNFDHVWGRKAHAGGPTHEISARAVSAAAPKLLLLPPAKHIPTQRYTYACEDELRVVTDLACDVVTTRLQSDILEATLELAKRDGGAGSLLHEVLACGGDGMILSGGSRWPALHRRAFVVDSHQR